MAHVMIRIRNAYHNLSNRRAHGACAVMLMILAGCSDSDTQPTQQITEEANVALRTDGVFETSTDVMAFRPPSNAERNA